MMAKITTTRYVVERKRIGQGWLRVLDEPYLDKARYQLSYFRSNYPQYRHRLVVEQESREVIG